MSGVARTTIAVFSVLILMIGSLNMIPLAQADDAASEKVPAPQVSEFHNFNKSETYNGQAQGNFDNEEWGISILHGDMITRIAARNYSNNHGTYVDYSMNFNFYLGGKFYIAMFTIDQVAILIDNGTLIIPLKNCDGFEVAFSPVVYDGTIPTMNCTATFRNIRAHSNAPNSAFDLTLINHFRGDWYQTSIKVEALLDFNGTDLGDYEAGEHFTAEVHYIMQLTDPSFQGTSPDFNTIRPSRYTDTTMEYNLTRNDGSPYSLSKLDMNENFTIYNATGALPSIGYSRIESPGEISNGQMQYNPNSRVVTHGFPDLIYQDTQSMISDPEVTVYHDRVGNGTLFGLPWLVVVVIVAVAAIVAVGAIVFLKRRRR